MKQLSLALKKKRKRGAGRPKQGVRASEKHKMRARVKPSQPVHVVCRVERDVRPLRTRHIYQAVRKAMLTALKRDYDPDNFFRVNQNIPPRPVS